MWKNADPGLPLLEELKRDLATAQANAPGTAQNQ
jgi:hypothetical protein